MIDREKVNRELRTLRLTLELALRNNGKLGNLGCKAGIQYVDDAISMLKEQDAEVEWCERCGRVRLKSKWERR